MRRGGGPDGSRRRRDRSGPGNRPIRGRAVADAVALAAALLLAAGGVRGVMAQTSSSGSPGAQALGRSVYEASCASCHGTAGEGLPGVYPPLANDPFLTASEELPVRVVLEGRAPAPDVPQMPSFGRLLSDREVAAVVSYVRSRWGNDAGPVSAGTVASLRARLKGETGGGSVEMPDGWRREGEALYRDYCAACHQPRGEGVDDVFPPLAGNPVVTSAAPPLVHLLLNGRGGMPAFARELDDDELAFVLSYIRTSWGNGAPPIDPETVRSVPHPGGGF